MPAPSALVLTIDGLQAGFLGPYGNTWIRAPHFDQLAAESFAFDQAFIADPRLEQIFAALWTLGTDSTAIGLPDAASRSLIAALAAAGVVTCLITDDAAVADHGLAAAFDERVLIAPVSSEVAAADIADTAAAEVIAAAAERLAAAHEPHLLWVHLRGMTSRWDAPLPLRRQYDDPEDPPSPDFVAVPDQQLAEDHDPDELLGIVHAYAGQVSLIDALLGVLHEALIECAARASTLFCLLGVRGFALGEHGRIGSDDAGLYSELAHIPWLFRFPDGLAALRRSSALVQQQDLPATLAAWWGLDLHGAASTRARSLAAGTRRSCRRTRSCGCGYRARRANAAHRGLAFATQLSQCSKLWSRDLRSPSRRGFGRRSAVRAVC